MAKKNALGRGLDALINLNDAETQGTSSISEIELSKIVANPEQPRQDFDEESLEELASSIRKIGVIQPITLREVDNNSYQIVAGERRYRASLKAGLETVPAYIRTIEDENLMEVALVENIQREDLNSIEIALAYQNLIDTLSITQLQLSERIGKKRSTITNYLRLLKLPAEVQMGVKDKKIDMGHARALITLEDPISQISLYNKILDEGLSVRKVETIVKELSENDSPDKKAAEEEKKKKKSSLSEDFDVLKRHLSTCFRTDVKFSCNRQGKGNITIPFTSAEELQRIIGIFDTMKQIEE